ncbi:hypothetical protein [Sinorhizobium meliloti]|nr:hypothetical protein [Sinorhizobium meliloti]MDE3795830.1 hypothetical protein [Sinorhizobium meliloti]
MIAGRAAGAKDLIFGEICQAYVPDATIRIDRAPIGDQINAASVAHGAHLLIVGASL